MSNFDCFRHRLRLTGRLRLETALRIGSGIVDELSGADIAVVKDGQRRPYVPGSSFKGALRAHIEQLVRVVEPVKGPGVGACNPLRNEERCIPNELMEIWRRELTPKERDAEVDKQSCRVCRVFGSPWLASKVLIKDLLLSEPELWLERRYQVRHGVGIARDSETASQGFLYDYETVPAGTEFKWDIIIENADQSRAEDGIVIWGLKEFANGRVQVGGSRSRGLGWIKLLFDSQAEVVDAANRQEFINFLITGKGRSVSIEELFNRAVEFAGILAKQEE